MALDDKDAQRAPGAGEKTLHVWSEPTGVSTDEAQPTATQPVAVPSLSEIVGSIKKDDFSDVFKTPCARQGALTGIAVGAGAGGLRFVLRGAHRQTNGNKRKKRNRNCFAFSPFFLNFFIYDVTSSTG